MSTLRPTEQSSSSEGTQPPSPGKPYPSEKVLLLHAFDLHYNNSRERVAKQVQMLLHPQPGKKLRLLSLSFHPCHTVPQRLERTLVKPTAWASAASSIVCPLSSRSPAMSVWRPGQAHRPRWRGDPCPGSNSARVDHSPQPHSAPPALSPIPETSACSLAQWPRYLHSRMGWGLGVPLGDQRPLCSPRTTLPSPPTQPSD